MPTKQYGVLPYVRRGGKAHLVLVTSRTSRSWIFPKGARVSGKSRRGTALQEAFEEAGLIGRIDPQFQFREIIVRQGRKIELTVYALRVEKVLKRWPEQKQRRRIVVPAGEAGKMVDCPQLRRCVKQWRRAS
ncbi:NUDIX hydrolase [Chachezhania antarctica]|uniref:NUDIX hydrolase n=1 Tax=Chachezhania antarctica TaxID=2340860 RepID=UPI000EB5B385|nr:NUDIX hydrolase [Chachezhania antarctica]|tara:strand:+ start:5114 stop:5509 length:396 start_codon:yes stop_codon:yes gene_type:complete